MPTDMWAFTPLGLHVNWTGALGSFIFFEASVANCFQIFGLPDDGLG